MTGAILTSVSKDNLRKSEFSFTLDGRIGFVSVAVCSSVVDLYVSLPDSKYVVTLERIKENSPKM